MARNNRERLKDQRKAVFKAMDRIDTHCQNMVKIVIADVPTMDEDRVRSIGEIKKDLPESGVDILERAGEIVAMNNAFRNAAKDILSAI